MERAENIWKINSKFNKKSMHLILEWVCLMQSWKAKSSNKQYWAKDRKDIFNSSELRLFHSGDSTGAFRSPIPTRIRVNTFHTFPNNNRILTAWYQKGLLVKCSNCDRSSGLLILLCGGRSCLQNVLLSTFGTLHTYKNPLRTIVSGQHPCGVFPKRSCFETTDVCNW